MKYIILWDETIDGLAESVNAHIADGFTPQGGVAISESWYTRENERKGYSESGFSQGFAQAMVRA
jgi:hypothetical protein